MSGVRVTKGVKKAIEGLVKNCKDFAFYSESTILGSFPEMWKPLEGIGQRRDMICLACILIRSLCYVKNGL